MTQQYGGGLTPQQQKQFSSWWLNEKYGGDFNNVEGLYQNETTGNWQADPDTVFDINPETGQKGQFKYMATPAFTGWIDVTPDVYGTYTNVGDGGKVKMVRNRHGLYSPEEAFYNDGNGLVQRYEFTVNPNTGEEGKWIWLGTRGWTNIEGDPQEPPAPGTPTFGNFGDGRIVGLAGSEIDALDSGINFTEETSGMFDTGTSSAPAATSAAPMQGGYSPSIPMQIGYKAQPLSSLSASSGIDYTKLINSVFTLDVLEGMMTGRKV